MLKKPSNQQFAKIFDKIASSYDTILNQYAVSRRIEFLTEHASGKCLEVGAGSGTITKALLNNKHEVVATDISPKMVKQMKRKLKINTYVSDAQKLPFKNASFKTVIAAEVIYYLDNPEKFFREARRILKPNGRLLISSAASITKIYDFIRAFLRKLGFNSMYFDDKNRNFMSEKTLKHLLRANGFKIKKLERAILFPFVILNPVNRLLEKTPLRYFCSFIFVYAKIS